MITTIREMGRQDMENDKKITAWHYVKNPVTLNDKIYKARVLGEQWLYLANMADERGEHELAQRHLERGQKWLDELNVLEGYGNGSE